jgi:hypothetical protein
VRSARLGNELSVVQRNSREPKEMPEGRPGGPGTGQNAKKERRWLFKLFLPSRPSSWLFLGLHGILANQLKQKAFSK